MERRELAWPSIICIGFTGNRTTIQACTLQEEHTSGGAIEVGSAGWDDTEGRNHQKNFQEVLKLISNNGCTKVFAVIWIVDPDINEAQTLQRQAAFINQFKNRDIWRNVLIIAEGMRNATTCCQGALTAAKKFSGGIEVMALSYKDIENADELLQAKLRNNSELQRLTNFCTGKEMRQLIKSKLDSIKNPIQVIFPDKQCLNCGVQGDERLLPEKCHARKEMIHEGGLQKWHPGQVEIVHTSVQEKIHTERIVVESGEDRDAVRAQEVTSALSNTALVTGTAVLPFSPPVAAATLIFGFVTKGVEFVSGWIRKANKGPDIIKHSCCGREQGVEGCKKVWKCCDEGEDNPGCKTQYSCCEQKVIKGWNNGCVILHQCCNKPEGSEGCKAICSSCRNPWGDPTTACCEKNHNLVNHL